MRNTQHSQKTGEYQWGSVGENVQEPTGLKTSGWTSSICNSEDHGFTDALNRQSGSDSSRGSRRRRRKRARPTTGILILGQRFPLPGGRQRSALLPQQEGPRGGRRGAICHRRGPGGEHDRRVRRTPGIGGGGGREGRIGPDDAPGGRPSARGWDAGCCLGVLGSLRGQEGARRRTGFWDQPRRHRRHWPGCGSETAAEPHASRMHVAIVGDWGLQRGIGGRFVLSWMGDGRECWWQRRRQRRQLSRH